MVFQGSMVLLVMGPTSSSKATAMLKVNGYDQPVVPGAFMVAWGDDNYYDKVTVTAMPGGMVRLDSYTLDGKHVGSVWGTGEGEALADWLRVLGDDDHFGDSGNGYYVEWGSDPTGERGCGPCDPETGAVVQPSLVAWRAP